MPEPPVDKYEFKRPVFRKKYDSLIFEGQFIDILVAARTAKKLTQKELAVKVGTTQSAIARYENGSYSPTLAFIHKLAEALEVRFEIRSV